MENLWTHEATTAALGFDNEKLLILLIDFKNDSLSGGNL